MAGDKKNILHIEDNANIQLLIKTILDKAGFQTRTAVDAMQGLMMAKQGPDLIILDIMMPAGGGVSLYQKVRQLSATMHIPIIIYSALPKDEIEKQLPGGHDCVILTKPCSPDEVVQTVKKILNPD